MVKCVDHSKYFIEKNLSKMSEFPVESNCSNFPSPANKKRPRNQPFNELRG